MLRSLVAVAAAAATATALAVAPAMADPVNSHGKAVVPKAFDVVGVGSDVHDNLLDQLSVNYNAAHRVHNKNHPWLYSWDAVSPKTQQVHGLIATKAGCGGTRRIPRPQGTGEGEAAFYGNVKDSNPRYSCIDFARAASPRSATDPPKGKGGVLFVALAKDAETYATNATTNAPANLTTAQLVAIYGTCTATKWTDVGGTSSAAIDPILPPASSGATKFFLKALGGITAGPCVNSTHPQQYEGTDPIFKNNPNAIVPDSVGKYIAQAFHSARCGKKPAKGQNEFGCAQNGKLVLHSIDGTKPTTGTGKRTRISTLFAPAFQRILYDVVRYSVSTPDHIPARLDRIFGSASRHGWLCGNSAAKADIASYGYLPTVLCGIGS
jgi:ABC-type phosphate transport system substrate-binding protein